MSCNTCHKNPCCCEKLISVRGLKGPKGDKGLTGPQGPQGEDGETNVFVRSNTEPYNYVVDEVPVVGFSDTVTITQAGNYLILFEGAVLYFMTDTNIDYSLYKNSVSITNSERSSRESWTSDYSAPIVTIATNSGVLSLAVGDTIKVGFLADKSFQLKGRSISLIQVNNLTIL